jgi:hypothetical protein
VSDSLAGVQRRLLQRAAELPADIRLQVLRVLAASPQIRADVIRQAFERPSSRELAEVLMDLEAEPTLRLDVMQVLHGSLQERTGGDSPGLDPRVADC